MCIRPYNFLDSGSAEPSEGVNSAGSGLLLWKVLGCQQHTLLCVVNGSVYIFNTHSWKTWKVPHVFLYISCWTTTASCTKTPFWNITWNMLPVWSPWERGEARKSPFRGLVLEGQADSGVCSLPCLKGIQISSRLFLPLSICKSNRLP